MSCSISTKKVTHHSIVSGFLFSQEGAALAAPSPFPLGTVLVVREKDIVTGYEM